MSDWITVSRIDHAASTYLPLVDYRFSATQPVVPLLVSELSQALPHYVMGFIKQGEDFHLVALLGRRHGSHLYVHPENGRWMGNYVPAALRGHPFRLATTEQGGHVLQISSGHLMQAGGDPLFDTQGQLSPAVQRTVEFLQQREKNQRVTLRACKALAEAGVLAPWEDNGKAMSIKGLYRFDELALNAKTPENFHALRGVAMAIAYAQMFSMAQLPQLEQRARLLEQHEQKNTTTSLSGHVQSIPDSLDELFNGSSENIRFTLDD